MTEQLARMQADLAAMITETTTLGQGFKLAKLVIADHIGADHPEAPRLLGDLCDFLGKL